MEIRKIEDVLEVLISPDVVCYHKDETGRIFMLKSSSGFATHGIFWHTPNVEEVFDGEGCYNNGVKFLNADTELLIHPKQAKEFVERFNKDLEESNAN